VIKPEDLREQVIIPALVALAEFDPRLNSDAAVTLLMGTAATESRLGFNLVQEGNGPAIGIFQMEEATHDDVWRYLDLPKNEELREIVLRFTFTTMAREMAWNLQYSAAMARIRYWYVPYPMPASREEQAVYY